MNINQKEILNETLTRFNELQIDMSFIQRVFDTYNCYIYDKKKIKDLIKITVDLIIKSKDIDLIIPSNFVIVNVDVNDNINRIIYWCFHLYYYNQIMKDIDNQILNIKNKNKDIDIRFRELHKCILAQQEYNFNEIMKINKNLLTVKKEYKFNMIIILNLQIFILLLFGFLFYFK